MRSDIRTLALVICATLAAACANSPPQTLAAANDAPGSAGSPAGAVDASLVKAGYSVMRRNDQVFYCRNEVITGNRIGTRVCLTAAQIQDEKQDVTKAKDMLNQPSYQCVGASCNN